VLLDTCFITGQYATAFFVRTTLSSCVTVDMIYIVVVYILYIFI